MMQVIPSGFDIAKAAAVALSAPGFETRPGYCQRWVREVIQELYGDRFDGYWRASAYETMQAFRGAAFALLPSNSAGGDTPLQAGDILYKGRKTSGRAGHTAIVLAGGTIIRVGENSSCHWTEADPDARGTRTLQAFGAFELIVRLSDWRV